MKHQWTIRITAILLFIIGVVVNYVIARRKFNRRAITGLETFRTFEKAWLTTLLEKIFRTIAILFILAGVFLFALSFA